MKDRLALRALAESAVGDRRAQSIAIVPTGKVRVSPID